MIEVFIFIFGTAVGSFLNVCIYRLPRSLSLIHPRSMCPRCEAAIAFYDNIPILSYLWLRGRCRHCGATISLRYPVVELAAGLFAVGLFSQEGLAFREALILYALVATLLVVTFIDIDHQIIPDVITLPGVVLALGVRLWLAGGVWLPWVLGAVAGAGGLWLVAFVYQLLAYRALVPLDSFVVQWLAYAVMLVIGILLVVQVPARIPRKLLLFDDHARVKYLSYRSVPISLDRLAELSQLRFRDVWLSRRIWKCVPLALGLLAPGLYLRRDDGWAYFFNVRDRDELVRLVREIAPGDG